MLMSPTLTGRFPALPADNTAQQRGFARTARTDDRHHFAGRDIEIDTVQHRLAVKLFHQLTDFIALILPPDPDD